MKTKINRNIALLLCLALALTLLPAAALAVDTTRIYCQVPEGWDSCKVYWWGGSGESYQWPGVDMQLSEGRIWGYDVPSDAEGIIFTNGEGQKTANLKVPTDDKVMYVFEHYFWGVYGQEEIEELYIVAGVSSLCGSDWDPTDQNNRMTDEDGDGIYTKLYPEVAPGTYHLKVTVGSWSESWGDPVSGANYTLEVPQEGLDVVVYFDTATQTMGTEFRGDHIPTPDFDYAISIRVNGYDDSPVTLKLAGPYTTRTFTIESPWVCLCDEIAAGEYTLTFRKKNHVDRVYQLTVTDQSVSLDAVLNLLGDVNEDGEVSIGDVARLYAHVRETALLTDYALACADFNQDGQVDVGDTGSLSIGGIIAVIAILIHKEILLVLLCGVFVAENLSVMAQVAYYKSGKRKGIKQRLFRRAPLHHHYNIGEEKLDKECSYLFKGPERPLHEAKITLRFWIVTIVMAVITLMTLKIR